MDADPNTWGRDLADTPVEEVEIPEIAHAVISERLPPVLQQLERCRPWLESALDGGFYSWADVVDSMQQGRTMLWPGRNSAILTEDFTYPNEKVCQVWLAGGDMEEILAMAPGVEAMARMRGCSSALVEGRAGWAVTLKDHGYEPWSVTLKKVL